MDDPFEYLTFSGTFGRSFGLLFDRFDSFMGISVLFLILFVLQFVSLGFGFFPSYHSQAEQEMRRFTSVFAVQEMRRWTSVLGRGAIAHAVAEIYVGRRPGWRQCLAKGWDRKWSLVGAHLLVRGPFVVTVSALHGTALADVWGLGLGVEAVAELVFVPLYAYSGLLLMVPVIMMEQITSPTTSAQRSWELARGSRCYLICTILCLNPTSLLRDMANSYPMDFWGMAFNILMTILYSFFFLPVQAIIETVLYLNLRIGRESMSQQVLSDDLLHQELPASRFRFLVDDHTPTDRDYRQIQLMDDTDADEEVVLSAKQQPIIIPINNEQNVVDESLLTNTQ